MFRKDYIQKVTDQLGQMLGKVLTYFPGFKDFAGFQERLSESEAMLKDVLGVSIEELLHLPASHWIGKLEEHFTMAHLAQVADIHFETAQLYFENKEGQQYAEALKQSLLLYTYLEANDTVYVYERYLKMERLKKQLSLN